MNNLPLPPGWTAARVAQVFDNSEFDDLVELQPDQLQQIFDFNNERHRPAREAAEAAFSERQAAIDASGRPSGLSKAEEEAQIVAAAGLTGRNEGLFDIARLLKDQGFEEWPEWGFVAVRAACYGRGQAERWERYKRRVEEIFTEAMRENGAADPTTGLAGRWRIQWVENVTGPRRTDADVVRQVFSDLVASENFGEGLEQELCFMADEGAVASVLDGQTTTQTTRSSAIPYIVGVIRDYDPQTDTGRGLFKIALRAVVPELYLLLNGQPPHELEPPDGMIWNGVLEDIAG